MRVALIKPSWEYPITDKEHTYNRCWPALDLLNCGAVLQEQGHDVQLVDAHIDRLSPERVAERVGSADLALVTSSALDRWQCPNLEIDPVISLVQALRNRCERLLLTGFHGTVEPEAMLRATGADAAIIDEPEETVRDLGAGRPIAETPGMAWRDGDKLVMAAPRPPVDMTRLPIPAFGLVDPRKYHYEVLGGRFMVLEGVRGCPYPCTFCSRVIQGKPLRRKSVEQLGREVEVAVRQHGVRNIYFIDLEFTASRELAEGISRYILERGLSVRWCCQTRTDWVDEPLLRLMKQAGCRLIHYGVETGSERIAELTKKKVTVREQREGVLLTKRLGIETLCFFMLGYPSETEAEMLETIRLAKELNPTYASFHRVSPYHGTPLYDSLNGNGNGNGAGRDLFPVFSGSADEMQQVDRLVKRALREFYLRPRYVASRVFAASPVSLWRQARLFAGYFR
jgi:anaerobic magnesium-protoporphyrin IX monomethyl ester cyclase